MKLQDIELHEICSKLTVEKILEKVILDQYNHALNHKSNVANDVMNVIMKKDFLDGQCCSIFKEQIKSSLLSEKKKEERK